MIRDNLLRIVAHLAMAEDLMLYSTITATTADQARQVNARTDVTIGSGFTGYGIQTASSIAPMSLGTIAANPASSPLTSQTIFATAPPQLPYELGGVTVSIGGVTLPLLYVGPGRILFFVPADVPQGTSQVIVTCNDGYVSTALATVTPNSTKVMTTGDDDNGTAAVVNSVTRKAGAFDVTTLMNFGADKRTRLNIFATGISGSAANTDPTNDVNVSGAVRPNFAESITVEARLSDGRVFNLPVEFAGDQGTIPGLDQVNVILIPELQGAGRVVLTLIVGGQRSNAPGIVVQ
jgi:uncharacterized protein (TIGR03437 family)